MLDIKQKFSPTLSDGTVDIQIDAYGGIFDSDTLRTNYGTTM